MDASRSSIDMHVFLADFGRPAEHKVVRAPYWIINFHSFQLFSKKSLAGTLPNKIFCCN